WPRGWSTRGWAVQSPGRVVFEEMAHGLAAAVLDAMDGCGHSDRTLARASGERRISGALRFIDAHLTEPMPLERLASTAKMSVFHFLRIFKQVAGVTPASVHPALTTARGRATAQDSQRTDS